MATIRVSYQDLNLFNRIALAWLEVHREDTKFRYALQRMVNPRNGRVTKLLEEYNNKVEDANVTHAATFQEGDKKGVFIREANGNYSFTSTGSIAWNATVRSLWHTQVEVEPYLISHPPPFTEIVLREGQRNPVTGALEEQRFDADAQRFAFEGFILAPYEEPTESSADTELHVH